MAVPDDATITGWALAAGAGDRAAATAFVRATQQQVHRFLSHLAAPREADDLTQETYLQAMRSLPSFAGRSSARTWLFTIARRVAANHHRGRGSRPKLADLGDWQAAAESSQGESGGFEGYLALRQLLDGLAPERRVAFVVTQVLGLPYAEAAEVCGCPVGTIRSRVARAREDLIEAMRDRDATGAVGGSGGGPDAAAGRGARDAGRGIGRRSAGWRGVRGTG